MPGKPRSAGKRKQWKRKPRVAKRRTVLVNRALHPLPQRYITKQKYSDTIVLTSGASTYLFNLNSVFDPNRTGVGHQPYGFDQLAALYNRYRVISCSWVINAYSLAAVRVGTLATNEQPVLLSMSDFVERPRAKFIVQIPGGNTQYLKGSSYIPSLVGRNRSEYMADDRYQAEVTSNPSELALLQVAGFGMNDTAADINLTVTLEYTVEYFDIKQVGQS